MGEKISRVKSPGVPIAMEKNLDFQFFFDGFGFALMSYKKNVQKLSRSDERIGWKSHFSGNVFFKSVRGEKKQNGGVLVVERVHKS